MLQSIVPHTEYMRPIAEIASGPQKNSIVRFHRLYVDCKDSLYLVYLADAKMDRYGLGRLSRKGGWTPRL